MLGYKFIRRPKRYTHPDRGVVKVLFSSSMDDHLVYTAMLVKVFLRNMLFVAGCNRMID